MKKKRKCSPLWLPIAGLLLSALPLSYRFLEYRAAEEEYQGLQERMKMTLPLPTEPTYPPTLQEGERGGQGREFSEELRARNPDYVFWLWIPGTNINYPVVNSTVPGFYLNHTFSGAENPCGSVFCQDTEDTKSWDNLILYGHNMKDGSMFADLKGYREKAYYEDHPDIWIFEGQRRLHYTVSSCMVIRADDDAVYCRQFHDPVKKEDYLRRMREKALYKTESGSQNPESLLTLSTCLGSGKRVIVQAVFLCYTD